MSFHRLAHLIRLDLSTCQISIIDSGAFDGLMAIQRIYLHGNHLVTISAGDLPPSLHGISVYDNRYEQHFSNIFIYFEYRNYRRTPLPHEIMK